MRLPFDPDEFFWCGSLSGRQEECGTNGQPQKVSRHPVRIRSEEPAVICLGRPNQEVSTRDSAEVMCLTEQNT